MVKSGLAVELAQCRLHQREREHRTQSRQLKPPYPRYNTRAVVKNVLMLNQADAPPILAMFFFARSPSPTYIRDLPKKKKRIHSLREAEWSLGERRADGVG